MSLCRKILIGASVVGGVLLTFSGLFLYFWMPKMITVNVEKKLALNNGSESYKPWEVTPIPIHFQIYFFNVTNPEEVLAGGKPAVHEMGPYAFIETREKFDIEFEDSNDTVRYQQRKSYYFSPELTNGTFDDNVTIPNVPLLAIVKQAQYQGKAKKFIFNTMMQFYKAKPFVTKPVRQLLFEGYKDAFVEFLSKTQKITILPNNTFGFFYGLNGSADGLFEVYRGNLDISKFTRIVTYNNDSELSFWNSTYCNMINGTDGSQYPPFVKRVRQQMFVSDFCRSLYLDYEEDEILQGIRLLRFATPKELLLKPALNPANACFNEYGTSMWDRSGAMNVSRCRKGAPIIVSLPHFYMADQSFIDEVDGLAPSADLHKTNLDIEPMTGVVMNAAKRLQMNADFGPANGIKGYENFRSVVLPLFWVYEGATIDEASANKFKSQVMTPIQLGKAMTFLLLGIGLFLILCLSVYSIFLCLKVNSSAPVTDSKGSLNDDASAEKLLHEVAS